VNRLGKVLLGVSAVFVAVLAVHLATTVDIPAKAREVRRNLEQTTTLAEFVKVAEGNALKCSVGAAPAQTAVSCWWFEPDRPYDLLSWFDFVSGAIEASGNFVDGRKTGQYEIRDVYTGP